MNNLTIPPSANWYATSILACTPDNTLIYGARNDIVIIYDSPEGQPSDIKIIHKAHSEKIISTSINRNWGQPHKLLVTVAEDNVVKLWDINTQEKKHSYDSHADYGKVVGANFAGDNKVIIVSAEGIIIIWNIILNETNVLEGVFGSKVTVSCISTCPHANWLTAFGLSNGLVVVTDLRKKGKVLYKLRGHDKSVLSLSWCPAPINVFPKSPHNYVTVKKLDDEKTVKNEIAGKSSTETDLEIKPAPVALPFNIVDTESSSTGLNFPEKNSNKNRTKNNIWTDLKHADDDELIATSEQESVCNTFEAHSNDDFLKECQNLKKIIIGSSETEKNSEKQGDDKDRVIMKAKRNNKKSKEVEPKNSKGIEETDTKNDDETVDLTVSDEPEEAIDAVSVLTEEKPVVALANVEKTEPEVNLTAEPSLDEPRKEKSSDIDNSLNVSSNSEAQSAGNEKSDSNVGEKDKILTCEEAQRKIPLNIPEGEEPRREFLLASSGKEGNVYIWRAGTDGRLQTFLTLPNKPGHRKSKVHYDKLWVVLCWVSPTTLLSSSKTGELVKWTLPKPKEKNKQFSIVHCDHSSLLFSIAAPIFFSDEYNWLDEQTLNVWTFGQDRVLLNTSLTPSRKNLASYPTLGNAECFAVSPVDPNRLAIGTTEGTIKIWDLSRPHIKSIVTTDFFQKIQGKVSTLAWHPTNELVLAYGTSEGRIGSLDTGNKSKCPTIAPHFFTTQIHKVEWGPLDGNKENLVLYALAEGKLVHTAKKFDQPLVELHDLNKVDVYTFAWKPSFSMLIVVFKSCLVVQYKPNLDVISVQHFSHRLSELYWHPSAILDDSNVEQSCYTVAGVHNRKEVMLIDLEKTQAGTWDFTAFKPSDEDINAVAWNPYKGNELVISGTGGIVQVWNRENDTRIATYHTASFEAINASIWSPVSSDHIISAAMDHTIRVWKIEDYSKCDMEEVTQLREKTLKKLRKGQGTLLPTEQKKPAKEKKKKTKTNLLPCLFYQKESVNPIGDVRRLFQWKEGVKDIEMGAGDATFDFLKVFGSKKDMLNIVEETEKDYRQKGKYLQSDTLSLFRGDLGDKIKEAIDDKRVTPWIIMMAPMVSPKLWQLSCEIYAKQLLEKSDSDPIEIATLFLACHKVEEALNVLCQAQMFREALALAKCRYPEDNDTSKKIIEQWAKVCTLNGNFEMTAQCFIYLGKYEDAAAALFRRSDEETLKLAVEIAQKSGNKMLHGEVLLRYNAFKSADSNPPLSDEIPNKIEEKPLQSIVDVVLDHFLKTQAQDETKNVKNDENVAEKHKNEEIKEIASTSEHQETNATESLDGITETMKTSENCKTKDEPECSRNNEVCLGTTSNLKQTESLEENEKVILGVNNDEEIVSTPKQLEINIVIDKELVLKQGDQASNSEVECSIKNKVI